MPADRGRAIALARGELAEADSLAASAAQVLSGLRGRTYVHIEDQLAAAQVRIELLTAQGRHQEALATAEDSVRRHDLQASRRYAWPLLVSAARAAAAIMVTPASARARDSADTAGELLGTLDAEAAKLGPEGPVERAHQLTYTAEVLRAGPRGRGPACRQQVAVWEQAAAAWEQAREPYPLATALFRAAQAALASGGAKGHAGHVAAPGRGDLRGSARPAAR